MIACFICHLQHSSCLGLAKRADVALVWMILVICCYNMTTALQKIVVFALYYSIKNFGTLRYAPSPTPCILIRKNSKPFKRQ